MTTTLITGTPGAGKTLYAVAEICRGVPGSVLQSEHGPVSRRLLSNINGLLVEHERIDGAWMARWHEHCRPGDVIVFDEIQELWRSRALGTAVPPAVQALETHRHLGVDLVFVTQHPMLIDANVRRMINRHVHVRRVSGLPGAVCYEWDHVSDPGRVRGASSIRPWRYPRGSYKLYQSSVLHTKRAIRPSGVVLVLAVAVVAGAFAWPYTWGRLQSAFGKGDAPRPLASAAAPMRAASAAVLPAVAASAPGSGAFAAVLGAAPAPGVSLGPVVAGCGVVRGECRCYSSQGELVEAVPATCERLSHAGPALALDAVGSRLFGAVADGSGDAAVLASMRDGQWSRR